MEQVKLERFVREEFLGAGADYEAHAATDSETGRQVVIKRPNPDYIVRQMHLRIEALSEQLVEIHRAVGDSLPYLAHLVGYTESTQHDDYFGDDLKDGYRVLVEERAKGVPLACEIRDKFKGIPIGLGQNLFALHPLVPHPGNGASIVQRQLLDLEESFQAVGHLALDMRPQNLYFDPAEARITVIDIGATPTQGPAFQGKLSLGTGPKDFHDFFLEVFRFYATPDPPPTGAGGYGEPAGMRAVPDFDSQIGDLVRSYASSKDGDLKEAAIEALEKIQNRSYTSFGEVRRDFTQYLDLVEERNRNLPDLPDLMGRWAEALGMLSTDYWKKYLFDPDADLAQYRSRVRLD